MLKSILPIAAFALLLSGGDGAQIALAQTGQPPAQVQNLRLYDRCGCQIMLDTNL